MVINVDIGNQFWSLRKRTTVLLTLFSTLLRRSSNANVKSNVTPRCFWEKACRILLLLKIYFRWPFPYLASKNNFLACLLGSGLKFILPWKVHFFKSLFDSYAEAFREHLHCELLKMKMYHQEKFFIFGHKSSARSFI